MEGEHGARGIDAAAWTGGLSMILNRGMSDEVTFGQRLVIGGFVHTCWMPNDRKRHIHRVGNRKEVLQGVRPDPNAAALRTLLTRPGAEATGRFAVG